MGIPEEGNPDSIRVSIGLDGEGYNSYSSPKNDYRSATQSPTQSRGNQGTTMDPGASLMNLANSCDLTDIPLMYAAEEKQQMAYYQTSSHLMEKIDNQESETNNETNKEVEEVEGKG